MKQQQLEAKIQAFIEQNEQPFYDDLAALIRIRSVETAPEPGAPFGKGARLALDFMLETAARMGLDTQQLDGYIGWAELRGEKQDYLATIAHLDIVPEGEGWKADPLELRLREGWLLGRGVSDDKGPALLSLYLAKFFKELELPLPYSMRFLFGTNEETGMKDVPYYFKSQPQPLFCFTPDSAFPLSYGEKGMCEGNFISPELNGNLLQFSGGMASNVIPDFAYCVIKDNNYTLSSEESVMAIHQEGSWRLEAKGIGGHAASPEGTVNAIGLLVSYLLRHHILTPEETPYFTLLDKLHSSTAGAGLGIEGADAIFSPLTCIGGKVQIQDGRIRQNINIRFPSCFTGEELVKRLQTQAEKHGAAFQVVSTREAFHIPADSPEIKALMESYQAISNRQDLPFTMGGGTYARHFKNAVSFGPGMPGTVPPAFVGSAHGAEEGISVETLKKAFAIYALSLWKLQQLPL